MLRFLVSVGGFCRGRCPANRALTSDSKIIMSDGFLLCYKSDLKSAQQRKSVRAACSAHVLATVFRRPFRGFRCREKFYDSANLKSIKNAFQRFLMSCCGEFQGQCCPFGVAVSIMTDSATKSHKNDFSLWTVTSNPDSLDIAFATLRGCYPSCRREVHYDRNFLKKRYF